MLAKAELQSHLSHVRMMPAKEQKERHYIVTSSPVLCCRPGFSLILRMPGKVGRSEDENLLAEVLWTGVHGVVSLKLIYPAFSTNSAEVLVNKMIQTLLNGLR